MDVITSVQVSMSSLFASWSNNTDNKRFADSSVQCTAFSNATPIFISRLTLVNWEDCRGGNATMLRCIGVYSPIVIDTIEIRYCSTAPLRS